MLGKFTKEIANEELKEIVKEYGREYKDICETSRNAYISTMPSGARIPEENVIYGEQYKDSFRRKADGFRKKVEEIINPLKEELFNQVTEAPTQETINAITTLKMRNKVSEDEFDYMLTRYGRDNVQAYKVIKDMAAENDYHDFRNHPTEEQFNQVLQLEREIERHINPNSTMNSGSSSVYDAIINQSIDNVLSSED